MNKNGQFTTAVANAPTRRAFAPYFTARWQNMQNIVNDSVFYAMVSPRFITYYQTYIQQWLEWARGFVPQLHQRDFFSTGIGYTVCDIFARECMSGGYRIVSQDEETTEFFERYSREVIGTSFNEMFFLQSAGGNVILSLTPIDGELFMQAIPINRIFFDIGRTGKITRAMIFNRLSTGAADYGYYARETRVTVDGKSYICVDFGLNGGTSTSPAWSKYGVDLKVPSEIQAQWEYNYGSLKPSTWYELPESIGIGLYNVKNKAVASAFTDMPGYSDSTLHTALDVLYSIDFNYSMQQLDMYWGRTRVLVPREMQKRVIAAPVKPDEEWPKPINLCRAVDNIEAAAYNDNALGDDIYCKILDENSVDGKPIQPEFIQPQLRGDAHKYIRDADLELLASKIGLSSSTLANHLTYTQSKTAEQVRTEQDTTAITVNNKRNLASVAINQMLRAIARFYGLSDDVSIVWNRYGANSAMDNAALLEDYRAGNIPKKEYLKRRFPDLADDQIDEWVEELKNEEPPGLSQFNLGGF